VEVTLPPGADTVRWTCPVPAGLTTEIKRSPRIERLVPAVEPKLTPFASRNPLPLIYTRVPPAVGPTVAPKYVMTGGAGASTMNATGALVPTEVVPVMPTLPGVPAGATTLIVLSPETATLRPGVLPKLTPLAPMNPSP